MASLRNGVQENARLEVFSSNLCSVSAGIITNLHQTNQLFSQPWSPRRWGTTAQPLRCSNPDGARRRSHQMGALSLKSFSEAWITLMLSPARMLAPRKKPTSQ